MLEALHYLQGYDSAPDVQGVTTHDTALACNGLNLIVSGHAPEAILMDMKGATVHRWHHTFDDIWETEPPDYLPRPVGPSSPRDHWRKVRLLSDGSLLVIFSGQCLIKIDRDSCLRWVYPMQVHHDLHVSEDGAIHTLIREVNVHTGISTEHPIVEDFVVVLSPEGRQTSRFSLVDCFLESQRLPPLGDDPQGDVFHTNSIRVLDGSLKEASPILARGNLLISLCATNTVAILDPDSRRVLWSRSGPWRSQHDPALLEGGTLLVFDNRGDDGDSRVIEFDPLLNQITWLFRGTRDRPFRSETCGTCQRLPNGNTLITESDSGRAFEVTPDGRVVWEYVNPHRAGENGELIATLLDVIRITEMPAWLSAGGS
jgi:hypothetical protein